MAYGKVRHLFPGGNTPLGFFSFYHEIITQEEAKRLIILKGGPGVGKSTFMKKIGQEMVNRGFDVELLHCSSDNNSLDGVKIAQLSAAVIDGTSPHSVDPKSPGAVDEILNFGSFWDEAGIRAHKEEIISTNRGIGLLFARVYRYLRAAQAVYEDSAAIYECALDRGAVNIFAQKLKQALFAPGGGVGQEGRQRSLFVSAITPAGFVNYLDDLLTAGKVYEITCEPGLGAQRLLEEIKAEALARGYYTEAYYCAMNPNKLEHLVIPALDAALTTANRYHASTVNKTESIDFMQFFDTQGLAARRADLQENSEQAHALYETALLTLGRAKALHDRLETCYIPYIHFEEIDAVYEQTVNKLLADS